MYLTQQFIRGSQRANLCSVYEDYEDSELNIGFSLTAGTIYLSKNKFFGMSGGSSLEWRVENATAGNAYYLLFPLEGIASSQQYYSVMYTYSMPVDTANPSAAILVRHCDSGLNFDIDSEGNPTFYFAQNANGNSTQWAHTSSKIGNTDGYIVLQVITSVAGDFSIFIDDFAISNSSASESDFGKYKFIDGTSMATPYVSGALGSLSNRYDGAGSLDLIDVVLKAVRPSNYLTEKVSTGGVLDLSQIPMPTLDLPTNESEAIWNKSSEEGIVSERIEVKNTVKAAKYEYSLDNGSTWKLCSYDELTGKWFIDITSEGVYSISVREQNSTESNGGYIYKIDANRPEIKIDVEGTSVRKMELTVTDSVSGLSSQDVEYVFLKGGTPDDSTLWIKSTLNMQNKVMLTLPTQAGTYNLYVKPISDISGWKSIDDEFHTFASYEFETLVTGLSLNKNSVTLSKGSSRQLIATVLPNNATNKDVVWESSDSSIVTVDQTGKIIAVGNGTANIIVSSVSNSSIKAICIVTVYESSSSGDDPLLQVMIT